VRIALFCPSFGQVGGIETKAERLIAAFRAAGHEVVVLARGATEPPATVPIVRVPFHQAPRRVRHVSRQLRFGRQLPGAVSALRRAAVAARCDVVLTLAITSYAPYAAALARVAPVVFSLEGGEPGGRFTSNPVWLRRALRCATRVVACARSLARSAAELVPDLGARLSVVPNGVDPERFAAGPAHDHPRPYVLAVGRLVHQKGFDVLLEAFARVASEVPSADLLIAGDGPERAALEQRRTGLGLEGRVTFLGNAAPPRVAELYRGAALVACPSRWEGLPLVCLEAMASGRAVIASAVDGIPDAVADGETGVLVPREDSAALAAALAGLLRDDVRRDRLGTRGRERVRAEFTWDTVTRRYLDVLESSRRS
jgi:glycogen(starch) synthase